MNIYVGNLPFSATEVDLRNAFTTFGVVSRVNVITNKASGQPRGYAFVEMANNDSAGAAIKGLNDMNLNGRNIRVNEAKVRGERPS